jgi:hypothetical protein
MEMLTNKNGAIKKNALTKSADPSQESQAKTGNLLSFATGYPSTRQIYLRRELTKSLSSDIVPSHQEILATPTPKKKKKKKKKKKATPVLPLFHEARHSPVSPEYKSETILQ